MYKNITSFYQTVNNENAMYQVYLYALEVVPLYKHTGTREISSEFTAVLNFFIIRNNKKMFL